MLDHLISAIGMPEFSRVLYQTAHETFSACQVVVYRYHDDVPECLANECDTHSERLRGIVNAYMGGYYMRDPCRALLSPARERETHLSLVNANQIGDMDYRRRLYSANGIAGRLSTILRMPDHAILIAMFRDREGGAFDPADEQKLIPHTSTLAAIVDRHYRFGLDAPRPTTVEAMESAFLAAECSKPLSEREAGVCARVVAGFSNEAISLELDLSPHTVATYRRRAYAKLNITSQSELFSVLLRQGFRVPMGKNVLN